MAQTSFDFEEHGYLCESSERWRYDEVYNKTGNYKKGIWSTYKIELSIDRDARPAAVTSKAEKPATAAIENIRFAIHSGLFANTL